MTSAAARRARLVRLRTIEHVIASARFARADAAQRILDNVALRVARLRAATGPAVGTFASRDLQGFAELSHQLDRETEQLEPTRAAARAQTAACLDEQQRRYIARERAQRTDKRATEREADAAEIRAARSVSARSRSGKRP